MNYLSIRMLTWNVNWKTPSRLNPGDVRNLLGLAIGRDNEDSRSIYPDFVTIGFQEIISMPHNTIMDTIQGYVSWIKCFADVLYTLDYMKVAETRVAGNAIALFSLRKHIFHLREVETQYTRLGFLGFWGSKSAVSIRLKFYGVSICIVNCHFPALDSRLLERIKSYDTIIDNHTYKNGGQVSKILYHDYILWGGDLNFRVEEGSFDYDEIVDRVKRGKFDELLNKDQLNIVRREGRAFHELLEDKISFAPTYKFKIGTSCYDEKRRPAWTDRFLYRCNSENYEDVTLSLKQLCYESHNEFTISDHKPITADFKLAVFSTKLALERNISLYGSCVFFDFPPPGSVIFTHVDIVIRYHVENPNVNKILSPFDWIGLYKSDYKDLSDYYAFNWSSPVSFLSNNGFYVRETVLFDIALTIPGTYVLLYISFNGSFLGKSEEFHLRNKTVFVDEIGQEADF